MAGMISAINKNKLHKFHNNDNSRTLRVFKSPNRNNYKIKGSRCMYTEEVNKATMIINRKISQYIVCITPQLEKLHCEPQQVIYKLILKIHYYP